MTAIAGTCRTCGHDLVQADGRTYHPWDALPADETCPDLIPLECGCPKVCYSHDVPAENFIPAEASAPQAPLATATGTAAKVVDLIITLAHTHFDGDVDAARAAVARALHDPTTRK